MTSERNVLIILSGILVIAAVYIAFFFYQQNQALTMGVKPTPTIVEAEPTEIVAPTYEFETPTPTVTPGVQKVVVVLEAKASMSQQGVDDIQARVVNPLLDYYAEQTSEFQLVSLTINKNTQVSQDQYPYSGYAIQKSGSYLSFLISKKDDQIQWWTPECMKCDFSESYKQKYPEVVINFK